jgi:hypothetical protein
MKKRWPLGLEVNMKERWQLGLVGMKTRKLVIIGLVNQFICQFSSYFGG